VIIDQRTTPWGVTGRSRSGRGHPAGAGGMSRRHRPGGNARRGVILVKAEAIRSFSEAAEVYRNNPTALHAGDEHAVRGLREKGRSSCPRARWTR
jgi:hypothetical protein